MSELASLLGALQPRVTPAGPVIDIEGLQETAWNQGFAAGRSATEAELMPLRERIEAAIAAFDAARIVDVAVLRPVVVELVRAVAEAVLLAELDMGAKALIPLVDAALALVRPGAVLRAHPAVLAVLAGHLPDMPVAEDVSLAIDGFEIVGPDFVIAAGLRARLIEIMGEMA